MKEGTKACPPLPPLRSRAMMKNYLLGGLSHFWGATSVRGWNPCWAWDRWRAFLKSRIKYLIFNSSTLCWNPDSHREYPFIFDYPFETEHDTLQGNFFHVLSARTGGKSLPKPSFFSTGKIDSAICLWREIFHKTTSPWFASIPWQPLCCCLLRREDHW